MQDVEVPFQRLGIGLSWDSAHMNVDADLQAVAFTDKGQVRDAVYYNNLKALGKALTHSGDELTGEKEGIDEAVWTTFSRLPADIKMIVFVLACHSGGCLRQIPNGKIHMFEDSTGKEVMTWSISRSERTIYCFGFAYKNDGGAWMYRQPREEAADGQHFIDILEPTLGNLVRQVIPSAPKRIKACFAMNKGAVIDLPKSSELKQIRVGLGWDPTGSEMDLDVSAVLLRKNAGGGCSEHNSVFFGNLEAPGVTHSGDNLTGEGSGDDETVTLDLSSIEACVDQIFFVINIYTQGRSFSQVRSPHARVISQDGDEMARYTLSDAGRESGLLVARLMRSPGEARWEFQALGLPCRGRTYKDSLPAVCDIGGKKPTALQPQNTMTSAFNAPPVVTSATVVGASRAAAPPAAKSSFCVAQ